MKLKSKTLKKFFVISAAAIIASTAIAFSACNNNDEPEKEEPSTVSEVAGVYSQYLSTDEIWDYLRSFQASVSSKEAQTVYELNTLVLTAGGGSMLRPTQENRYPQVQDGIAEPIIWDASQRRYELTKEFRMTDVGVHLTVIYYGTYTFNNRSVTLLYPEYASVNYFYGTGWNGCEDYCCYMFEPGDVLHNGANAHTLDPFAAWYGSYIEPSRSDIAPEKSEEGNDSMLITLSMLNKTFTYDVEEANKANKQ